MIFIVTAVAFNRNKINYLAGLKLHHTMKQKRPLLFTAVILSLSIGNYFRIAGNENIRPIQFLSIFVIGMLAGVLLMQIAVMIRGRNK